GIRSCGEANAEGNKKPACQTDSHELSLRQLEANQHYGESVKNAGIVSKLKQTTGGGDGFAGSPALGSHLG
ncbi:MAG: hypothetical protein EBT85_10480, partial [Synechococcaceae bacterium WB5_2B_268]|nr:hypothetical protein [Synechococcaceae bacterium WB5_2B_268]